MSKTFGNTNPADFIYNGGGEDNSNKKDDKDKPKDEKKKEPAKKPKNVPKRNDTHRVEQQTRKAKEQNESELEKNGREVIGEYVEQNGDQTVIYKVVAPEKKTRRVLVVLPPTLYSAAKEDAESEHISFNEYVCRALAERIQRERPF